jgi:putative ABC transport system ATP-binding protein
MKLIRCNKLSKEYTRGDNVIRPLDELTLAIESGVFLALMGPSGSGKTTLLNLMAGIDRPTSGELVVGDQDIAKLSRRKLAAWRAGHVGYVFQLYNLVPVLTAYENVELPLLLHPLTRKERHQRICTALELVGLEERYDHYPRQLSGGQEQRVAIARAIVADPTLILADEPTGDLDKEAALAIMKLFARLHREMGKTLIMVTHDPHTAEFADTTLHLEKGRLVEQRSGEDVAMQADPAAPGPCGPAVETDVDASHVAAAASGAVSLEPTEGRQS